MRTTFGWMLAMVLGLSISAFAADPPKKCCTKKDCPTPCTNCKECCKAKEQAACCAVTPVLADAPKKCCDKKDCPTPCTNCKECCKKTVAAAACCAVTPVLADAPKKCCDKKDCPTPCTNCKECCKKTAADQPVNKVCPIEPEHKIDPKVTYKHKDQLIGFCCADCIDEFKKDPEKYLARLK